MKSAGPQKFWRLYDAASQSLYDGLTVEKVASMISALDPDKMGHWFVARQRDLEWTPVYKCYRKFMEQLLRNKEVPLPKPLLPSTPPVSSMPPLPTQASQELPDPPERSGKTFYENLILLDPPEKRREPRTQKKVKAVINIGIKTYETFTTDFSLDAIKVDFTFTDRFFGLFDVVLMTDDGPVELRCSAIQEPGTLHWSRMKISPECDLQSYSDFLGKAA